MVKLKRSPKYLDLDINVAKNGHSAFFCGKQQISWRGVKIRVPRNTAGPDDQSKKIRMNCYKDQQTFWFHDIMLIVLQPTLLTRSARKYK